MSVANCVEADEPDRARIASLQGSLFGSPTCRSSNMEGPHGELRARLAYGLRGYDAYGLSQIDLLSACEIAAVAFRADPPPPGLTGKNGADQDILDPSVIDFYDELLVDLLVRFDYGIACEGIMYIFQGYTAKDSIAQGLDDLSPFNERSHVDPVKGLAVHFRDDGILGHIHEPSSQIAGVGRLQGRVCKTFAGSVGRNEVLEDCEPLPEVRGDRGLDDLARWFGHQPAHPGKLANLRDASSRSGIGHHEDRVEAVLRLLFPLFVLDRFRSELSDHLIGDFLGGLGPDIDDLVVPLAVCDQPVGVLVLNLADLFIGDIEDFLLLRGNLHVIDTDRDPGLCGHLVPEVLESICKEDCFFTARYSIADIDQIGEPLLIHNFIDGGEGDFLWTDFP